MNNSPILACQKVTKKFQEGQSELVVLKGVDFILSPGEKVAIVGNSGSGKTTLLQLLGGLDKPTSGQVEVMGQDLQKMTHQQSAQWRNQYLGFVYQFHHLLPEFTALENVMMPLLIQPIAITQAKKRAIDLLTQVGLGQRLAHKPAELSGGERQRVAVARALVTRPACVLADEPTGNLDANNANEVYRCLLELNLHYQTAFVIVTHDLKIAERVDRVLVMKQGVLSAA